MTPLGAKPYPSRTRRSSEPQRHQPPRPSRLPLGVGWLRGCPGPSRSTASRIRVVTASASRLEDRARAAGTFLWFQPKTRSRSCSFTFLFLQVAPSFFHSSRVVRGSSPVLVPRNRNDVGPCMLAVFCCFQLRLTGVFTPLRARYIFRRNRNLSDRRPWFTGSNVNAQDH